MIDWLFSMAYFCWILQKVFCYFRCVHRVESNNGIRARFHWNNQSVEKSIAVLKHKNFGNFNVFGFNDFLYNQIKVFNVDFEWKSCFDHKKKKQRQNRTETLCSIRISWQGRVPCETRPWNMKIAQPAPLTRACLPESRALTRYVRACLPRHGHVFLVELVQ